MSCDYVYTDEGFCSDCSDLVDADEGWEYCPYCGEKIRWTTQAEKDAEAYDMYIESEIDWKRECAWEDEK